MAPFPTKRALGTGPTPLLPTHSPVASGVSSFHAYPPAPSPSRSPPLDLQSQPVNPRPHSATPLTAKGKKDLAALLGHVGRPKAGSLGGIPGISWESTKVVQECLNDNHLRFHTFTNDEGFHNHTAHHLLAAYSLGAGPSLLRQIYEFNTMDVKTMIPLQPIEINEQNWTEYLGDERFYPNYLSFFNKVISTPPSPPSPYAGRQTSSMIPVLEKYLLGGLGDMLIRAVSGAIHPLIHIGHGVEFGLDAVVAEGLAQCAVHKPVVAALFDSPWPPTPPKPTSLQSTLNSAFTSLKFNTPGSTTLLGQAPIASGTESFAKTAANLPRDIRIPREGLSGFSILDRILHDPLLAAGQANGIDDFPRLNSALEKRGEVIKAWCDEWKFSVDASVDYEDDLKPPSKKGKGSTHHPGIARRAPSWDEIVEKCEELFWMATIIYASASRPGYQNIKLDFFTMHGLTSVLFLPPLLEAISPHLRPYLLHSHFRVMLSYWISRGRPNLYVKDTLLAATAAPIPPHTSYYSSAVEKAIQKKKAHEEKSSKQSEGQEEVELQQVTEQQDQITEEQVPSVDENETPSTPRVDGDGKISSTPLTPSPTTAAAPASPKSTSTTTNSSFTPNSDAVPQAFTSNGWAAVLASASDHPDDHLPKVIRSLAFAATHFGHSPPGMYQSSLPGTETMDGSIFLRAAGLTFKGIGWCHEGEEARDWDRSVLGFDQVWEKEPKIPSFASGGSTSTKGKEPVTVGSRTAAVHHGLPISPVSHGSAIATSSVAKTLDPTGLFVGDNRETNEEEQARRLQEEKEEEERELMA